jgi:hypothetical protein
MAGRANVKEKCENCENCTETELSRAPRARSHRRLGGRPISRSVPPGLKRHSPRFQRGWPKVAGRKRRRGRHRHGRKRGIIKDIHRSYIYYLCISPVLPPFPSAFRSNWTSWPPRTGWPRPCPGDGPTSADSLCGVLGGVFGCRAFLSRIPGRRLDLARARAAATAGCPRETQIAGIQSPAAAGISPMAAPFAFAPPGPGVVGAGGGVHPRHRPPARGAVLPATAAVGRQRVRRQAEPPGACAAGACCRGHPARCPVLDTWRQAQKVGWVGR